MHPGKPQTDRARLRFSETQHIDATPEAIFPLLCPVREYDWIPGWECELIYTESGLAEDGCIFRTDTSVDDIHDTWVVSRYEPPRRLSFVRVNPLRAIRYDIVLEPGDDGSTRLLWSQEITALDEAGDAHVAAMREDDFTHLIETEERMLEHYLKTGEALHIE